MWAMSDQHIVGPRFYDGPEDSPAVWFCFVMDKTSRIDRVATQADIDNFPHAYEAYQEAQHVDLPKLTKAAIIDLLGQRGIKPEPKATKAELIELYRNGDAA